MDFCHAAIKRTSEELFCETIQEISPVEYFTAKVTVSDDPVKYKCNLCSYFVQKGSKQKVLKLDKFTSRSLSVLHVQSKKSL